MFVSPSEQGAETPEKIVQVEVCLVQAKGGD